LALCASLEISKAISYEDRRDAICTATVCFDHNLQSLHDEEMEMGADAVLSKHLGFLMSRRDPSAKDFESSLIHELSCTCDALEMIHRASVQAVAQSFEKNGKELLKSLIRLVNQELSGRLSESGRWDCNRNSSEGNDDNDYDVSEDINYDITLAGKLSLESSPGECPLMLDESSRRDTDTILRKATKIMGHFARVSAATQPMAYCPGLLSCLISVLSFRPLINIPPEVRLNSLWIISNLACNSNNMVMMACHPTLMSSLVAMAARRVQAKDSLEISVEVFRSQAIASRALVNLACATENRMAMAENHDLLDLLSVLIIQRQSDFGKGSKTIQDLLLQTRQYAVEILRNLASSPRKNKSLLCQYQQGKMLNVLTDAALNDPDGQVKEKAFSTIQQLANHETAEAMVQNPALILALKDALLSNASMEAEGGSSSFTREYASSTLIVLERSITPDNPTHYQALRELLNSLSPSAENDD
jgi:hypothetical protein